MSPTKLVGLFALALLLAGATLADGIDPTGAPKRGPTNSLGAFGVSQGIPICDQSDASDCSSVVGAVVMDDYDVENGTVKSISIAFPEAFFPVGTVTCGVSNAFVDAGKYNPTLDGGAGGFLPLVTTENGVAVSECNYGVYPTPPNYRTPAPDSEVPQIELLCTETNENHLNGVNDPDDCEGVPSVGIYTDVVFVIVGATPVPDMPFGDGLGSTAVFATTPEPASIGFLLLGLGSLGVFARRRRLAT